MDKLWLYESQPWQLQIQAWIFSNLPAPPHISQGSQAVNAHLLSFYVTFMFLSEREV